MNNTGAHPLIRALLLGVLSLSLSACGTRPVRVEQRATDLQVLKLGVKALTEPRVVSGPVQHPDQAKDNGELMDLALDLDDIAFLSNEDKRRLRQFVFEAADAIDKARRPACRWYQLACHRGR